MENYKNLGGGSNVAQFEIGNDYITVKFMDNAHYEYTYSSAGESNIEHMKVLARRGQGLNSFIVKSVSKLYARKW